MSIERWMSSWLIGRRVSHAKSWGHVVDHVEGEELAGYYARIAVLLTA